MKGKARCPGATPEDLRASWMERLASALLPPAHSLPRTVLVLVTLTQAEAPNPKLLKHAVGSSLAA